MNSHDDDDDNDDDNDDEEDVFPVRNFLMELADDVTAKELEKMIFVSDTPEGEAEQFNQNVLKFFNYLIRSNKIQVQPLKLTFLLKILPNKALKKKVTDFRKRQCIFFIYIIYSLYIVVYVSNCSDELLAPY